MMDKDLYQPFLLENLDIRGALVQLRGAWRSLQAGRDYAEAVGQLLGELATVSVLIGANLKQAGRLTFQMKGSGPIELLVMDCDHRLRLKGMARAPARIERQSIPDLLGHGRLALTLDLEQLETPYQSLVPLDGATLATIFEHFLAQSEQQPTRLFLMADDLDACGLLLQRLPSANEKDPDGWNRIQRLSETVRPEELARLDPAVLLRRLYPEDDIRLFASRPVSHHCPKDWDKVRTVLLAMGRPECEVLLQEQGEVRVQDEICNHEYAFDATAVAAVFAARTLH